MSIKAFAYLRKSTDRKDKQRYSLETQEREIQKAKAVAEAFFGDTVEIVETFTEKISGTSRERPLFDQMLEKFDNQEASILLSWRLDRLSRNPTDAGAIMQAMQDRIIPYVADNTRVYTRKDSWLLMGVLFGQASQESMEIADKSIAGTETLIKNWGIPYKVPFWAKNNPSTSARIEDRIIIDPIESVFAKKMFEKRANGESYEQIAIWLFENGFKNKNGGKISKSTIHSWIKNKFYYGLCEWGNHVWNHMYQPIIDKKLWEEANAVGRGFVPRIEENQFLLKWKIKSAISGRVLTASFAKKIYPQYHTHASWKKEWDNVSISEAKIIEYFGSIIHLYKVPNYLKKPLLQGLKRMYKEKLGEITKEKQKLSSELTKTTQKMDGLIDMRITWELTGEQYKIKSEEFSEKINLLKLKITNLIIQDEGILDILNKSVELLTNLDQYWNTADTRTKLGIINMICV